MNRFAAPAQNIQGISGGRPGRGVPRRYLQWPSPRPLVETCLQMPALPDRMLRELFVFHPDDHKRSLSPVKDWLPGLGRLKPGQSGMPPGSSSEPSVVRRSHNTLDRDEPASLTCPGDHRVVARALTLLQISR